MGFDFAAVLATARRVVHDTFALEVEYYDPSLAGPVPLRVRWHYKQVLFGDLDSEGYPQVVDLIQKAIFDDEELLTRGVTINVGGRLTIKAKGHKNAVLVMHTRDDDVGAVNETWRVGKLTDDRFPP